MFIFEKSWFSSDLGLFWPFFDQNGPKKGPNGDENLKISWNRVHIRIQHRKVSIKRYMMRHIKKVDFRARKWLSVKIWPLIFFSSKSTFFTLFSRIEWFATKEEKKFFLGFFFIFLEICPHPTRQNAQNLDFENFPGHAVFSRG